MQDKLVNLPKEELDAIIRDVASKKKTSDAIVEKDFWVCLILDYLFHQSPWRNRMVFKGGTSLSKAYNLIERFSEDIDIILDWRLLGYAADYPYEIRSNNQQDIINKEIIAKTNEFIIKVLIPRMVEDLNNIVKRKLRISFQDDAVVIEYGNTYSNTSILNNIRLEIGALAAWTPTQEVAIRPYISEVYPNEFGDNFFTVRTTTPERTFWEKATILHREAFRPDSSKVPSRMSRHYYDIDRMAKLGVLDKALLQPELLEQVASFKAKFYPQKWARYDLANFESLRLVPPTSALDELRRDYEAMEGMFYGLYPKFEELMKNISEIEKKIKKTAESL